MYKKVSVALAALVMNAIAVQAWAQTVTFIPASKVSAAFEKGVPLLETTGYKIHASRREAPGMAEVHVRDELRPDGTPADGVIFFDMTNAPGEDAIDGLKVDREGNVYVSGPGGLWIFSASGRHLGTIMTPEHAHNLAWGDADGRTLYLTAKSGLYRIRLSVAGSRAMVTSTP